MGLWHVFYEDWQMECCGTPFRLGDEVSWPLLLSDADEVLGGGWHDQLTRIAGPVEDVPGTAGATRVVRGETGLTVALQEDPVDVVPAEDLGEVPPGDRIHAVGLLTAESHTGADLPAARGRVRAIQVVTQGFAEPVPGSGTWEPVVGERSLRSVRECPKWFAKADAGVLVTLEVPDTDSLLSYALRENRGIPHEGAAPGAETEGLPPETLAAVLEILSRAPAAGPERP
ncbi:hypothetical protein ACM01_45885 [Streptomyces viridochromogenes]|uniref:Uncharacterized protein n=1 Tax=Streptomyces viridochromogenes TaxID=1938 RepID=A0A0J7YSD3_STRVR|nr:DUF6578 domain-containing protein [Streptomyces viridochromogenes]KMS66394.1 hypothetical protein ACM01_45885 [Streptomyces viridochromogenes]KOG13841.1 hypothetical protein ADK36_32030 [Streptomyces viridochromogenes]KOG28625.1 hypothetical protein ADK35_03360 [Streptomyces viridochromogenes]